METISLLIDTSSVQTVQGLSFSNWIHALEMRHSNITIIKDSLFEDIGESDYDATK